MLLLLEKYEAEYVDRFANPFPAATRGELLSCQSQSCLNLVLSLGQNGRDKISTGDYVRLHDRVQALKFLYCKHSRIRT